MSRGVVALLLFPLLRSYIYFYEVLQLKLLLRRDEGIFLELEIG